METLGPIDPWLLGCIALAVVLFVAREIAAGLLWAVGGDLWEWLKRRRAR